MYLPEISIKRNSMKKILLTILSLIIFTPQVYAEIVHISLEKAISIAKENNLALQAKRKKAEALRENVKIADALKNPQFQSNFLMGKVTRGNSSQFGLSVPVEIAKRSARKKVALAELKIAEDEINAFEHNIKIEIMKAYYNILYMKSVVIIAQERENLYRKIHPATVKKSKTSSQYDIDVLQNDIKYQKQLIFLNQAKAQLLDAQFELNDKMDVSSPDMYDTMESSLFEKDLKIFDFELLPYSEIEKIAMQYSYALTISASDIKMKEAEVTLAKHQRIPDITIAGGYAYQTAHQTGSDALPGAFVGVGFDIPVFYSYVPDVKKAEITVERTKFDRDSFENHLKYALKKDYNDFRYAKSNLEHYKVILENSKEVLESYKKRYEKGQVSILNVFQVENSYQETLREYINAVNVYYISYLNLMKNVGHDILIPDNL